MRNRERRHDADDVLIKLVAAILVLALAAWAYAEAAATKASPHATAEVPPVAAYAPPPPTPQPGSPVLAPPASVSSINGKALYECAFGRSKSFQTQACAAPWVEVAVQSLDDAGSRTATEAGAEIARQQAEARLAAEQARFAQLTGTGYAPSRTRASAAPRDDRDWEKARCANAKAVREQTLEIAGIKRDYDLIRRLNDQVYEACKNT
jgi:hypothetical protein